MKAIRYDTFGGPLHLVDVPDPTPTPDGVVVRVGASGLCRSDWHGWKGHDPDVKLPHVPGHELARTVIEAGTNAHKGKTGDRVTGPVSMGCGTCHRCRAGDGGAMRQGTGGGPQVATDAVGSPASCRNSILSLRKRGRHIQVGLLLADQSEPPVPMSQVIARELEIRGTHGLQAREYAGMLELITKGRLHPEKLLGKTIALSQVGPELAGMDSFPGVGVTGAVMD